MICSTVTEKLDRELFTTSILFTFFQTFPGRLERDVTMARHIGFSFANICSSAQALVYDSLLKLPSSPPPMWDDRWHNKIILRKRVPESTRELLSVLNRHLGYFCFSFIYFILLYSFFRAFTFKYIVPCVASQDGLFRPWAMISTQIPCRVLFTHWGFLAGFFLPPSDSTVFVNCHSCQLCIILCIT